MNLYFTIYNVFFVSVTVDIWFVIFKSLKKMEFQVGMTVNPFVIRVEISYNGWQFNFSFERK